MLVTLRVFFSNSVSFGAFRHSKGLGANSASGVSWGKFRRPRKRFCGGFPQHLSPSLVCSSGASSAGLEKGSLGSLEGSPNFSLHLSPTLLFEKGFVDGSPNFSLHLSPSLLWLCGRFPELFSTLSPNFLFEKGSVEGSPNFSLHLSPGLLFEKRFCGRFPQLFFSAHLSPNPLFQKRFCGRFPQLQLMYICLPVFSSKQAMWKVPPTFLYICLPVFFSKKVIWKAPLTFLYICLPVFSGLLGPLLAADPTYVSIFPQQR